MKLLATILIVSICTFSADAMNQFTLATPLNKVRKNHSFNLKAQPVIIFEQKRTDQTTQRVLKYAAFKTDSQTTGDESWVTELSFGRASNLMSQEPYSAQTLSQEDSKRIGEELERIFQEQQ